MKRFAPSLRMTSRGRQSDRMRDAGREVLAYGIGIVDGVTAAIAHIRDRGRTQGEPRQELLKAIRDRLEQRAMRRDAYR